MKNVQKIYFNCLLLVFLFSVLLLPALSGGMMKVNKDDRVLSITSKRPTQIQIKKEQNNIQPTRKIETVIIREIPNKVLIPEITKETTQSTESTLLQ